MSEGPLAGVRVLDLSRVFAGPWATQALADLGAEVIKVERPGRGDDARGLGPPFLPDQEGKDSAESAFYLSANRNKKSIALDLSLPRGQDIIRQFAAISDVVVENFKVGTLSRYALDYESLRKINPSVVYCSITGFGQTGPYSHRPGYDTLFQAMGGVMSVTGAADEAPGGGPMKVGIILADIIDGDVRDDRYFGRTQASRADRHRPAYRSIPDGCPGCGPVSSGNVLSDFRREPETIRNLRACSRAEPDVRMRRRLSRAGGRQ